MRKAISDQKHYRKKHARIRSDQNDYKLQLRYGITREDFDRMLVEQDYLCLICGQTPTTRWHVDHDHATGKVRGVLCAGCNVKLGVVENREWAERAEAYLARGTQAYA